MKKLLTVAAVVCLVALPAHADITIGLVMPVSGSEALTGEQLKLGAEQAVADINVQGGINGKKVTLYIVDDACDPKQGVEAANKIASAGIKFVTGFYCSSAAIPASKVYMEENILMVAAGASNPRLTDEAKDLVFRTNGRDDQQGAFDADYIRKHFAGKKIAIINDQSAWGAGLTDELKKNLNQAGVKEILFDSYTTGGKDYSFLVTKLKQIGTQVLFLAGFPTEVGLIVRQLKDQGAQIQVIGGDALATDQFWQIAGPTAEGVLMSFMADPAKLPEAKAVVDEFIKGNHSPDGLTLFSYAAMQTIAEGIRRAGADPIKAAAALRTAPVKTVVGTISYDDKGDRSGNIYVMYRWHNGRYVEIGD